MQVRCFNVRRLIPGATSVPHRSKVRRAASVVLRLAALPNICLARLTKSVGRHSSWKYPITAELLSACIIDRHNLNCIEEIIPIVETCIIPVSSVYSSRKAYQTSEFILGTTS
jgi:hypothetical protein